MPKHLFCNLWNCKGGLFDVDNARLRLEELNVLTSDPDLWNNPGNAQKLMTEKNRLEDNLKSYDSLRQRLKDCIDLIELAETENDATVLAEAETTLYSLEKEASIRKLESLLSAQVDINDAFLEIHAGAGGTEAQDWAAMLLRMYAGWATKHNFKIEYLEESPGEEAGLKSVIIKIKGKYAYGWLKTESGVHRLVRISPFDANARRHTSFASVWVYPVIDDSIHIDINPADCRIDTYRASGAGGQHINKTDSAIRITHLPTGIVVQCQNQRSQFANRDEAWAMLRARLYEFELQKKAEKNKSIEDSKAEIGWGYQIRSYVLQPYQLVKDLRTQVETSDTNSVLNGEIDLFLSAALAAHLKPLET